MDIISLLNAQNNNRQLKYVLRLKREYTVKYVSSEYFLQLLSAIAIHGKGHMCHLSERSDVKKSWFRRIGLGKEARQVSAGVRL